MTERAISREQRPDAEGARFGMWLFLATEVLLFTGPVLLYAAYRYRFPDAFASASASLDTAAGTFNTVVLLTSSLTMALSVTALKKGMRGLASLFLISTVIFGCVFLVNKYAEWAAKLSHGVYPGGAGVAESGGEPLFWGLYYFTTGLHGLHVASGVVVLGALSISLARGFGGERAGARLECAGLFWHLVDVVWIFLFPLFYLVR